MDGLIGCRPLTDEEVEVESKSFGGKYGLRDRCLFLLGVYAGYRIGELLSLRVEDVMEYGRVKERVTVGRRSNEGQAAIALGETAPEGPGRDLGVGSVSGR